MPAPSKRRHVSYYLSLPLVVAIGLLLVAQLAALQRADVIAELVDRVTHQDAPEAAAAVRQLAEIPRPPITVLVVAATSADRVVADEAQQAISKLLRRAQRQIEARRGLRAVKRQLGELAESLANQRGTFLRLDYAWLADTTRKIVRLANQMPPQHSPLVAMHCDEILVAIAPVGESHVEVANGDATDADPFVTEGAQADVAREPRHASLQRQLTVTSTTPSTTPAIGVQPQVATETAGMPPAEASLNGSLNDSWRASWANPMFRMAPPTPVDATPDNEPAREPHTLSPSPETMPGDVQVPEAPMAETGTRQLLDEWRQDKGGDVAALEEELARRGFSPIPEPLVQRLCSKRMEDRLRLIDDVLIEPGIDARPWLMLLAEDSEADVRLAAVTIMATSNDAELVEKAWQVAIQDRDPRVAELAGRLRERRASIQR